MFKKMSRIEDEVAADGAPGEGAAPEAPGSVLSEAAAEKPAGESWIPEKFRVTGEDGALDVEASAKKIEEHRANLERRLGAGDVPPKTPDEYAPELKVDGFEWDAVKDDQTTKDFVSAAHKAGLTNAQLSFVLTEWFTRAPQIMQGDAALTADQVKEELMGEWKDDAAYKTNVVNAYRAFEAYAAAGDRDKIDEIGNNPIVIRLLANIGKGMQEDTPPGGTPAAGGESIETLLASEAYTNPRHPDHAEASEKVRQHFQKKYGTRAAY